MAHRLYLAPGGKQVLLIMSQERFFYARLGPAGRDEKTEIALSIAAIHPPEATQRILQCLGLPTRPPPLARAVADATSQID